MSGTEITAAWGSAKIFRRDLVDDFQALKIVSNSQLSDAQQAQLMLAPIVASRGPADLKPQVCEFFEQLTAPCLDRSTFSGFAKYFMSQYRKAGKVNLTCCAPVASTGQDNVEWAGVPGEVLRFVSCRCSTAARTFGFTITEKRCFDSYRTMHFKRADYLRSFGVRESTEGMIESSEGGVITATSRRLWAKNDPSFRTSVFQNSVTLPAPNPQVQGSESVFFVKNDEGQLVLGTLSDLAGSKKGKGNKNERTSETAPNKKRRKEKPQTPQPSESIDVLPSNRPPMAVPPDILPLLNKLSGSTRSAALLAFEM